MSDIENTIKPEDVEWLMKWNQKNEDGSRKYPDKPEEEWIFETPNALAHLLLNEVIFLNDHWWEKEWPEAAQKTMAMAVNCNDIFMWGCSDCEGILRNEIEGLYRLWKHESTWGAAAWCIFKRKRSPQTPVLNKMVEKGWDIDWLLNTTEEEILTKFRKGPTDNE